MNKTKNYETEIPENYVLVKHVDAKSDKKLIAVYSLFSFIPPIILTPILFAIAHHYNSYSISENFYTIKTLVSLWIFSIMLFAYLVLHEIVHGITYKYFTGSKLAFGLTLTVAFCGVPNIYVRKKASVAALIMPFSVFSVIFTALTIGLWFLSPLYGILAGITLAIHLGGCVGDLHWTLLYLTKFRHCNTLMRDTGPEQWLYIPKDEAEKYNITSL